MYTGRHQPLKVGRYQSAPASWQPTCRAAVVVESVRPCLVVNSRTRSGTESVPPLKLQLSTAGTARSVATARSAASPADTPLPAPPPAPLPPPLLPPAPSSPLPLLVCRHLRVLPPLLLASANDAGSLSDGGFGWGGGEMGPATDDSEADEADGSHSCKLDGGVACSASGELVAKDGRISTALAACCSKCSKVTARLIPER